MSSLNGAVFGVLCAELGSLLLLVAPMPNFIRAGLIRWVSTSSMLAALQKPVMYFAVVVLAMWAATVRDVYKYSEQYNEVKLAGVELANKLQVEVQMFRSQRNFYLSGACLLVLLVIYRIYGLLRELNRLEATSTALKKQADGAMGAYSALQKESEELKAKLKVLKAGGAAPAEAAEKEGAASDDDEISRLREQNKRLAAERTAAEKDTEALKRQSEGLAKEYERVLQEKSSLENKLADFELLMGDAAKKSK